MKDLRFYSTVKGRLQVRCKKETVTLNRKETVTLKIPFRKRVTDKTLSSFNPTNSVYMVLI